MPCRPTPRCSRCARSWSDAARRRSPSHERRRRRDLPRPGVRRLSRGPTAVAGAGRSGPGPRHRLRDRPRGAGPCGPRGAGRGARSRPRPARGDDRPRRRPSPEAVCADAREFDLGRTFPVALAPMQTVQLLGGRSERERFLRCAREHVEPSGLFAIAVADAIESFDEITATPPLPDVRENGGTVYFSQPVAVHDEGERFAVHFVREIVDPDGGRTSGRVLIHLDRVDPGELEAEAAALGFTALERRTVPATDAYVGSAVVMLGG